MKYFKLHTGMYKPIYISRDNFENYTKGAYPYVQTGMDQKTRCFAVCPACDNPIQLIGLYTNEKGLVYGKHYNSSVKGIAPHNQQSYEFCPNANRNSKPPKPESRNRTLTDFEKRTYCAVRDTFDLAIAFLEKETGLYISNNFAEQILKRYISGSGWLYDWSAIYNIPWMLLYLYHGFPLYGRWIKEDSDLARWASSYSNIVLELCSVHGYVKVGTQKFERYNCMFKQHRRTWDKDNDEVKETICFEISVQRDKTVWETLYTKTLEISREKFLDLIAQKATLSRNEDLLKLAGECMPEI